MNKAELHEAIYEKLNGAVSKNDVEIVVNATFSTIFETLRNVKTISIREFGTFEMTHAPARKARNPKTGESIDVPAKNKVKFKPAPAFQDKVNFDD